MNPIELIKWANSRHSSKFHSLASNYIVVLFSKVLFIYLFNLWHFEPNHSADYRGPLMAEGGVQIRFLLTGWCNSGKWPCQHWNHLNPPLFFLLGTCSGMGCFLKCSFLVDADEQTPVAQMCILAYFSAILLHKSSIWEKMRCMVVLCGVTTY